MIFKQIKELVFGWLCRCGNSVPSDRNFCPQCDREKPFTN